MRAWAVLGVTLLVACSQVFFPFLLRDGDHFWGTSEESHILGILEASKRLVDAAIHSTMERCRVGGPGAGGAPTTQRGPGPVPEPAPPTVTSRSPCFTDQAEAPSLSELARTVLMLRCHVRCL
uniref:Thyroid peroxidase n=1 Tax=Rousettus aegyptiacus TaxID=9407 RepID=A0A7J8FNA0_ROUAE|nr:thyroid peroxidase [Rousettus aegyptiacus]